MSVTAEELQKVREEIGRADDALVRDLVALDRAGDPGWAARAMDRPAYRVRVELGRNVAEVKFRRNPALRPAARQRDEPTLERLITDVAVERTVLERVRRQALDYGGGDALARQVAKLYRDHIIPETKRIQIARLVELAHTDP